MSAFVERRAKWIPFLAVAWLCMPAHAKDKQLPINGVPQAGSQLCWAAVSEMITNHMGSTTRNVSQGELAAYNSAGTRTPEKIAAEQNNPVFLDLLEDCIAVPDSECDSSAELLLLGLTSRSSTTVLSSEEIVRQIDADKPVAVRWQFAASTTSSDTPFKHQMIVVGYANDGEHVLIWDPWPYDIDTHSKGGSHYKWLEHEKEYKNERLAMGADIQYESEVFNLDRVRSAPLHLNPPPTSAPPVATASIPPPSPSPIAPQATPERFASSESSPISAPVGAVPFADAIRSTAKLSSRARAMQPKPRIEGLSPEKGPRTAGQPIPIVVLKPDDLLAPRIDLKRLLQPVTRAVLYPVLSDGMVVDSYLATIGPEGWVERGYTSTEVTRRLVEQRRTLKDDAAAVYVVAIPAWATFFVAQGVGDATQLTPIATTRFSETGRTVPASTVLSAIAHDIRSSMDETRRANHVRTPLKQP